MAPRLLALMLALAAPAAAQTASDPGLRASKMKISGMILAIAGTFLIGAGAGALAARRDCTNVPNEGCNVAETATGIVALLFGIPRVVIGVPLWITGGVREARLRRVHVGLAPAAGGAAAQLGFDF